MKTLTNLAVAALALGLAACVSDPLARSNPGDVIVSVAPEPQISVAAAPRIAIGLDVAEIEIVEAYLNPVESPLTPARLRWQPDGIARTFVRERLRPVGKSGTLTVELLDAAVEADAAVIESRFPILAGADLAERYVANLRVRVTAGGLEAAAGAMAIVLIPSNASLAEASAARTKLEVALRDHFEAVLMREIINNMGALVRDLPQGEQAAR